MFISLKTQTLYVRQGFEPIFESPVTIRDPEQPIGTHTYTAVGYGADGRDMRWNVVSIGGRQPGESDYDDQGYDSGYGYDAESDDYYYDRPRRRRQAQKPKNTEPVPTDVAAATAALDRITIPPDVATRISELVLPGHLADRVGRGGAQGDGQADGLRRADQRRAAGRHQEAPARDEPVLRRFLGQRRLRLQPPRPVRRGGPFSGGGLFGMW